MVKVKEFFNGIEKPMVKYFLFSCLDTTVGAVGMLVYGILTSTYGPVWVRNQYFGLWITTIIFYYSIQSIYLELRSWNKKAYFFIDVTYFIISTLLPLLLIIFYGIAIRIDGIIWSIYIFAVNLTNVTILYQRKHKLNEIGKVEKDSDNNESNENELVSLRDSNKKDSFKNSKLNSILIRIIKIINHILRIFFIIVFCFLINGAIIEAVGKINYTARGKFVDAKISNNTEKTIKFHFLCDGPKTNQPVFLFEGSASHGLADYLSLQILLKEQNRRSCIWDKPGLGYSDYLYTEISDYITIYHNLINSLGETGPFNFVGWGGGSSLLYEYAYYHPEMFKSLTFLDSAPVGIEFKIPSILKNWTDSQLNDYKSKEFASRKSLFSLINGLGVPFGLMGLFLPSDNNYYFKNLADEMKWYFLTEKTWITQEYFLPSVFNKPNVFEMFKINQDISINILMTYKSEDQVKNQICKPKGYSFESVDCKYEIDYNKLMIKFKSDLLNLTKNGFLFNCILDDCDLGYYVYKGANYTVEKLIKL